MESPNAKKIEEILEQEGMYVSTTSGVSMQPLFRDRRDTVIISPVQGRLKKYDLPLYKRGDQYILHRVVKVLPDSYVICGDNCISLERDITDDRIVGVMTAFYRKDRYGTPDDFWYKVYVRVRCNTFYLRVFLRKTHWFVRSLVKKEHNE